MHRDRFAKLAAFSALVAALAGQASCLATEQAVRLEAAADACASAWDQDKNFGTATTLKIYADGAKALLRFNLDSVPASAKILSATLTVTFDSVGASVPYPITYLIYDVGRDFSEPEATYKQSAIGQPWTTTGLGRYQDYDLLETAPGRIIATAPGQYSTDITAILALLHTQGKRTVNLAVLGGGGNSNGFLDSREQTDPRKRPQLEVRYSLTTPVAQASGALLGAQSVRLDGSASTLPDGSRGQFTYSWTILAAPSSSSHSAGQKVGDSAVLSFSPAEPGSYLLQLQVTNPATGETGLTTMRVVVGLGPHPRLHMNAELLAQIRALRNSGDKVWTRFYQWVEKHPTSSDIEGGVTASYLLAYLVTGQQQYLDWSWEVLRKKLYKNGTDRTGGFNSLLDLYGDSHGAAYTGGPMMAQVAMLYDWGFGSLSSQQKQDILDWLNAAVFYTARRNPDANAFFRNDGAAVTYGIAAAAYATLGENPQAQQQLEWFWQNWAEVHKALDIAGPGGAGAEGNAYGTSPTAANLIRTANLVSYASGENLFLSHPWFRQRLMYDAFAAYPGTTGGEGSLVRYGYPGTMVEQASIGGDGRRGYSWHSVNLRPNGLALARAFSGTEEAQAWNWVYRRPDIDQTLSESNSVFDVLYYSPPPARTAPSRWAYFDPGMGYVYIRSGWNSPDDTWIAFWAGPHLDTHQHLDQGAFAIFKRRDLAPKTGSLDRASMSTSHSLAYYTRTISSNGLLIGDPSEVFANFISGIGCDAKGSGPRIRPPDGAGDVCVPNDGGQRTMSPLSMGVSGPATYEQFRYIYETAKVVHFQQDGNSVSVVADLTNAYSNPRYARPGNSPKVNRVYRRLVYLKNLDLLLVGDTVESTNAAFEKKWLLHSLGRIDVNGTGQDAGDGETVYTGANEARIVVDDTTLSDKNQTTVDTRKGYATLLLRTVFPTDAFYRKVGGRDPSDTIHPAVYPPDSYQLNNGHFHTHRKDFWVKDYSEGVLPNHRSANWMPQDPIEDAASVYLPIYGPGYGRWRLEVEPGGKRQTDYFLNILKPAVDAQATLPLTRAVETADTFGTVIQTRDIQYRVEFSKNSLDPPKVTLSRQRSQPN